MIKQLFDLCIPHDGNDHHPELLSERMLLGSSIALTLLFMGSAVLSLISVQTGIVATIYPSVLVDLANESRIAQGKEPLAVHSKLERAAALKADHMVDEGYFAHFSPEGVTPWHWISETGYSFSFAGENLAKDFQRSRSVTEAWMGSKLHRQNLLSERFQHIGIAKQEGSIDGEDTTVIVQMFARPFPPNPHADQALNITSTSSAELTVSDAPQHGEVAGVRTSRERSSTGTSPLMGELRTIEHTDTWILVKRRGAPVSSATASAASQTATAVGAKDYTPYIVQAAANPALLADWIFISVAFVLLLVITGATMAEMRKNHPRHIFYGCAVLLLTLGLLWLNHSVGETVHTIWVS